MRIIRNSHFAIRNSQFTIRLCRQSHANLGWIYDFPVLPHHGRWTLTYFMRLQFHRIFEKCPVNRNCERNRPSSRKFAQPQCSTGIPLAELCSHMWTISKQNASKLNWWKKSKYWFHCSFIVDADVRCNTKCSQINIIYINQMGNPRNEINWIVAWSICSVGWLRVH